MKSRREVIVVVTSKPHDQPRTSMSHTIHLRDRVWMFVAMTFEVKVVVPVTMLVTVRVGVARVI